MQDTDKTLTDKILQEFLFFTILWFLVYPFKYRFCCTYVYFCTYKNVPKKDLILDDIYNNEGCKWNF